MKNGNRKAHECQYPQLLPHSQRFGVVVQRLLRRTRESLDLRLLVTREMLRILSRREESVERRHKRLRDLPCVVGGCFTDVRGDCRYHIVS